MKRVSFVVGASLALSGLLVGAAGPVNAQERTPRSVLGRGTCSGTLASPGVLTGTYGDVVVKGYCNVNGGAALVLGNLTLAPGAALNATYALNDVAGKGKSSLTVFGDVKVQKGSTLAMGCLPVHSPCSDDPNAGTGGTLTGSNRVFGNLVADQALAVIVHASWIQADVVQRGGGGGLSCNVPTSGIFSLLGSPVFSDYEDNTVFGNLKVTGLQTCWFGALRDTVHGNVVDVRNTFADPDADEVHSNTVWGNIACFKNAPAVQYGDAVNGFPNKVGGYAAGQCGFGVKLPNPVPSGPLTPISVRL
jgi:hypothetical protein